MRWPWGPWKPASKSGEPEDEGLDPAVDHHRHFHVEHGDVETESASSEHHRHFHVEHGDVETESASSEHWPVLPVEEAVHVEDPAADQNGSGSDEATRSSESDDGHRGGGWRRPGRGPRRRRGRRSSLSGLPVSTFVGAAAAVLLALVAVVASWRRGRRRPAAGS